MIEFIHAGFIYESETEEDVEIKAVEDIQLSIGKGECIVLCGRSGCGKSTLLRMMNGLAPQFYPGKLTGTVKVFGKNMDQLTPENRAKQIATVFQDPRSQFFMSMVGDEIVFSAENLGLAPDKIEQLLENSADRLEITDLINQQIDRLSSGQKQKVAIAAATHLSPSLLLMDEPTANLDKESTDHLMNILKKLKAEGTTIVISEHRLHSFLSIADRYICLDNGRIAKEWTKGEFSQLSYDDVKPYGLRHPDLAKFETIEKKYTNAINEVVFIGEQLSYSYKQSGRGILQIDISLKKGSVLALTGENGAGKTTLCKILSGLIRPQKGRVLYRNKVSSNYMRRKWSHFVMQDADYQLFTDSVTSEVLLGKKSTPKIIEQATKALQAFDLYKLKDRHPASLSGGEKQRVTIAAAYSSDAEFIILDEPTSGLDGEGVLNVANWLRKLAEVGKTVIIITHDPLLVQLASDDVMDLTKDKGAEENWKSLKTMKSMA